MKTTTHRKMTAALALALAVGLTACETTDDGPGVSPQSSSAEETTPAVAPAPTEDDADTGTDDADDTATDDADDTATDDLTETALRAIDTAEKEAGGTAYEIDDQDDDGTWEVDVAVGDRSVEVTVSEDGRSVVGTEDDDLDDEDKAGLAAATITIQDAIQLAIDEVGGVLDDAELEEDDGQHYWEVEVDQTDQDHRDDVKVKVSVDGKVLSVDR